MPNHFQVEKVVESREELEELKAFAREPARTVDACHEWLLAKGYTLSRSAVGAWKRKFLADDRYAASAETAKVVIEAAKSGGVVSVSDAVTLQMQHMIFEQLLSMQEDGTVTAKDLRSLSTASRNAIAGKLVLEELRTKQAEAIAEAEKEAKAGGSAEAVVSKVREILGIGS